MPNAARGRQYPESALTSLQKRTASWMRRAHSSSESRYFCLLMCSCELGALPSLGSTIVAGVLGRGQPASVSANGWDGC